MSDTSGPLQTQGGYVGAAWLQTAGSVFNALDFVIRMVLADDRQADIVKVIAVHGGGTGSPPTVDVQPMVNQVDGFGNQTPHGVVYGLPCFRLQGGNGAVILDPVVGDKGLAVFCDRDISTVKATGADLAARGLFRQRDFCGWVLLRCAFNGRAANELRASRADRHTTIVTTGALTFSATNATLDSGGNLPATVTAINTRGPGGIASAQHDGPTRSAAA